MKRVVFFLIALAAMGAQLFAGGRSQPGSQPASGGTSVIRWSYWGSESRIKNTQLVIDAFTEKTGIIVAAEPAPGTTEHFNKFKTQFAGGNAADIVQLGGDFANLQVGDDVGSVLQPLTPFVNSGVIDLSKVDQSAIDGGTVNGVLYALPVAANMPCLLYNKALLQRVGAPLPKVSMTWDEFRAWLVQVKAKLPAGVYAMTDNSANISQSVFFGYWMRDNGTPQWNGKQSMVKAQDAQKYFDWWDGLRKDGLIPPAAASADYSEENESSSILIAGKAVVRFAWSNQLLNFQNAIQDELDLIEMPNAAVNKKLWGQMSQMMAISKNSKNAQAAAQFINYRVSDPEVWKVMGADPGTPVNSAARAAVPSTAITTKVNAYLDIAGSHSTIREPNMPGDTEYNNSLYRIAQEVAYGRITTAQGGQQTVDLITRLTR